MLTAIYLDLDGVLVDLIRHTFRVAGVPEERIEEAHALVTEWNGVHAALSHVLDRDFTEQDLYALWAREGQEFWASVPWTTHGRALYALCSRYAPVVLMTTPTIEPSCAAGKVEWIQRNMPADQQRRYALSPCKHHMAHPGALLVDDGEHNVARFVGHGGEAYLWPGPWNASRDTSEDEALEQLTAMLVRLVST